MAAEKPKFWLDVELRSNAAFAVLAAIFRNLGDPVEHQHWRQRQLGVASPEQIAAPAGEKVFIGETGPALAHYALSSPALGVCGGFYHRRTAVESGAEPSFWRDLREVEPARVAKLAQASYYQ